MLASEFAKRQEILCRYFEHPHWKSTTTDSGFKYHKAKKNLKELKQAISIVFDESECHPEDMYECYEYDLDGNQIGATCVCSCYVNANFNGMYQGTGSGMIHTAYTLYEDIFAYKNSQHIEDLIDDEYRKIAIK